MVAGMGKSEQSYFAVDPETGLDSNAGRTSFNDGSLIIDLKTTLDASPKGFQRSVSYRYYVQAVALSWMSSKWRRAPGHRPFCSSLLRKSAHFVGVHG